MRDDDVRINLHLPATAEAMIDRLCSERKVARTTLVRQALGVLQVVHEAQARGKYVGTTRDIEQLEMVIATPI